MSSHYSPIPIINRMYSLLNSILASPNGLRANELLRTALREENRAYVQIDPAE